MKTATRWLVLPALLLVLASPAFSSASKQPRQGRAEVLDHAELFSPTAEKAAEPAFNQIRRLGKDLVIETFAEAPAPVPEPAAERAEYFEKWARDRAREEKIDGVYVLVNKSPGRFEIVLGNQTAAKGFTPTERSELRSRLQPLFQEGNFDAALGETTTFVSDRMQANLRTGGTATPTGTDSGTPAWLYWVLIGLAVLVAIWIIRALLVAMSASGGGGGFFSAFLGGLFGVMAGMWLYDSFFGGGATGADTTGGGDATGGDQGDTGYSSEGGDFGGDGGGDFGGGDF